MEKTLLQARLTAAYNYFHQRKHLQNMQRIKELAQKLETGEYGIAFAGHFDCFSPFQFPPFIFNLQKRY